MALNAIMIQGAMRRQAHAETIASKWLEHNSAKAITPEERLSAQTWANMNVQLDETALNDVFDKMYASGYAFGIEDAKGALSATYTMDWDSWKPGNAAAALLVDSPNGLDNLLRASKTEIKGINKTTLNRIGSALSLSLSEGLGAKETAKAINYVLNDPARALTIARTETARALITANQAEYRAAGVEQIEWLVGDPCKICAANAGSVVLMGQAFPSGAEAPPAHPNCVCDIAPVIDDTPKPISQGNIDTNPQISTSIPNPKSLDYLERQDLVNDMKELFDWENHPFEETVREYSQFGYARINESLRNPAYHQRMNVASVIERTATEVNQLKQVIEEAAPLIQDTYSYRGIMSGDYADVMKSLNVGDEFIDKGFVSTSLDREASANNFAFLNGVPSVQGMLMEIVNPAGTKGLMIGGDLEEEWLLPAGSRFRVIEVIGNVIKVMVLQ